MKKQHYEFYYEEMLNDEQKVNCNEITKGKDFDNLTLNQKIQLSFICIPDEINFFRKGDTDTDDKIQFNPESVEYKFLDFMEEKEWETYIEIMASRGLTIEFDSVEDNFVIF